MPMRLRKYCLALVSLFLLCSSLSMFSHRIVWAATNLNPIENTCRVDVNKQSKLCQGDHSGQTNPVGGSQGIISRAIKLLLIVAGAAAVIVIIIAGFEYVFAGGDSNKINNAKNTILYALIGLVIVISAGALLNLVIGRL